MKSDWEATQKAAKKEMVVRYAKEGGIFIGSALLGLLAIGGMVTVAVVAPNVLGAYGKLTRHRQFYNKNDFNVTRRHYKRLGYIDVKKKAPKTYEVKITERGLSKILQEHFGKMRFSPGMKDGFWRLIIFDIPEEHKQVRESFREKLCLMGAYKLQKSVFVVPTNCKKEVDFLCGFYNIEPYVHLITAKNINNDQELKRYFNLV